MRFRFTIFELLLSVVAVACTAGWVADHQRLARECQDNRMQIRVENRAVRDAGGMIDILNKAPQGNRFIQHWYRPARPKNDAGSETGASDGSPRQHIPSANEDNST